jgi:guanylate kinase
LSEPTQQGELFILSAPSGAGKTTLIQSLMTGPLVASGGLGFSVSYTTRKPRQGEVDGKDYHFVDPPTFRRMIAEDRFLEWAEVHGNHYGTANDEVFPRLEKGIDVLLDIDVQGTGRVLERYPPAHGIFIMPPSYDALVTRLRQRGQDAPQVIDRRLAGAMREMPRYDQYHYVIVNDDVRQATEALTGIILAQRHRKERMLGRVQDILKDFQQQGGFLKP